MGIWLGWEVRILDFKNGVGVILFFMYIMHYSGGDH